MTTDLPEAKVCACNVGPGKFEGEPPLTFLAYHAMLHGDVDATTQSPGISDWFRRPFNFDADPDAIVRATAHGYCKSCIQDALDNESFGLVLTEDSNGFVYLVRYTTELKYDAALQEAMDSLDESEEVRNP